jgi:ribonuclease HI
MKKQSIIYTDGSCLKPGGASGWCFILFENNRQWVVSGFNNNSTNNRMELTAVLESLKFSDKKNITIYSDSKLTINCAKKLWNRKSNLDLWDMFDNLSKNKIIEWIWVKAHNGDKYNEIVDKIARKEANDII